MEQLLINSPTIIIDDIKELLNRLRNQNSDNVQVLQQHIQDANNIYLDIKQLHPTRLTQHEKSFNTYILRTIHFMVSMKIHQLQHNI